METKFWTEGDERHKKIAYTFYRNIEDKHPDKITSRGMCPSLEYSNECRRARTKVQYPEYTGPDVKHI